jgi:hypothetical protein
VSTEDVTHMLHMLHPENAPRRVTTWHQAFISMQICQTLHCCAGVPAAPNRSAPLTAESAAHVHVL